MSRLSEPILKLETFDYAEDEPFVLFNISAASYQSERLQGHWHQELEILYLISGSSLHYIDGSCYQAGPGQLLVTNMESVHNIIPLPCADTDEKLAAVILMIHPQYLESVFPGIHNLYFRHDALQAHPEAAEIMWQLSRYADRTEHRPYDHLYAQGLILQLLYYLFDGGYAPRDTALSINIQKNAERLKGVLQYVADHYREPVTQAEVAQRFYFNRDYFSRYFKKSTGISFSKYLQGYRLQKAKNDLLTSSDSILHIALRNGFTDDRRLINAFKERYGITPLQFRKNAKYTDKIH